MSLLSLLFIFGPVVGFVPQYLDIKKTGNSEGFSNKVCLILLLSNILRCFFWLGKQFDITLLYQSIVMIVAQLLMLHLCVSIKSKELLTNQKGRRLNSSIRLSSLFEQKFWEWDNFFPYVFSVLAYSFFFFILSYMFLYVPSYFDLLGTLSLTIESLLGVPQLIQNFKKKSTKGLSLFLISSWFVGDLFKTLYFVYTSAPLQFVFCGSFQLLIDIAITAQLFTYKN
ncbi:hypothetical protein CYY_007570 [Polysphondylium violaceum]|uniref:Solute carrier family 66 member 2 n=1 Tax=Polysphondylium violaceum TaxID=133409 RepID=A0A8J4PQS1_9MYCE|nr:hypothetical protein CYY_007570 [Polysphondylium violaceum]